MELFRKPWLFKADSVATISNFPPLQPQLRSIHNSRPCSVLLQWRFPDIISFLCSSQTQQNIRSSPSTNAKTFPSPFNYLSQRSTTATDASGFCSSTHCILLNNIESFFSEIPDPTEMEASEGFVFQKATAHHQKTVKPDL